MHLGHQTDQMTGTERHQDTTPGLKLVPEGIRDRVGERLEERERHGHIGEKRIHLAIRFPPAPVLCQFLQARLNGLHILPHLTLGRRIAKQIRRMKGGYQETVLKLKEFSPELGNGSLRLQQELSSMPA